jgi:hypothetical protein
MLACSALEKMPTKRDAAGFGCKQWIENAFKDMAVTPEDIGSYCVGTVAEQVRLVS